MGKQLTMFLLIPFLLFYALPVSADEKEENTWQNEMVYYMEVDRFYNGNPHNDGEDIEPTDPLGYHGGDLEGIIKKLDYLQEMGFTTILLSSIFKTSDLDSDKVADLKQVDEHFGTMDDFKRLVTEAHKREMKVMIEFTVTDQIEKSDYVIDAARWWIDEGNIDGYLFQYIDTIDHNFWKAFHEMVNSEEKQLYTIGSLSNNTENAVSRYRSLGFTSILDEHFYEAATNVFSKVDQPLTELTKLIDAPSSMKSTYLDQEDTERFTWKATENNQHPGVRLKMAMTYMYTTPGTPIVYYGTEIALNGGKPPENKPLMNFLSDEELIDYISKLAKVRKSLPALTDGDFSVLYEKAGMIIYKRTYKDETAIVAINNTSKTQKIMIQDDEIGKNKELRGLVTGDIFHEENQKYEFILDRETAEIYELEEKKGLNLPLISVFILVPILFIGFLIAAYKKGKGKQVS